MRIGIVICDRYRDCAGGKCFRATRRREGGFSIYSSGESLEVVGFVSCGGCPGVNLEYAPEEMVKNGAEAIHLSTGFVVGYPPCPWTEYFAQMIEDRFDIPVVIGTHPIPEKYLTGHANLSSRETLESNEPLMSTEAVRMAYN
jgi:predicted metal-binding protein